MGRIVRLLAAHHRLPMLLPLGLIRRCCSAALKLEAADSPLLQCSNHNLAHLREPTSPSTGMAGIRAAGRNLPHRLRWHAAFSKLQPRLWFIRCTAILPSTLQLYQKHLPTTSPTQPWPAPEPQSPIYQWIPEASPVAGLYQYPDRQRPRPHWPRCVDSHHGSGRGVGRIPSEPVS